MVISNRVKAAAAACPLPTRVMSMGSVQSPQAADRMPFTLGGLNVWGPMPGNSGLPGGEVTYGGTNAALPTRPRSPDGTDSTPATVCPAVLLTRRGTPASTS